MPPKPSSDRKQDVKTVRPPLSDSSLLNVPSDVLEGFQGRLETGIEWTLIEKAAMYHKQRCRRPHIPQVYFTTALETKIKKSILNYFLNENTNLSLRELWDVLLSQTLWDIEHGSEESKICFNAANCITDDLLKSIERAVRANDRELLRDELRNVCTLRIIDAEMTSLDEGLCNYHNLITLNISGNFISDIGVNSIPSSIRILEMQANGINYVTQFAENLLKNLLYLGLARNLLNNDSVAGFSLLSLNYLTALDISDNDIYDLERTLDALACLRSLVALQLAGNPCSVCAAYARVTLRKLPNLKWLDSREVLSADRLTDPDPHPQDFRSTYFNFSVLRIISAPQPPKPEKGEITTFHVELELPMLDSTRRSFLMYRRNESLEELMPLPEDGSIHDVGSKHFSGVVNSKIDAGSDESDIYDHLESVNSRVVRHYTIFESTRVQWNKMMNFQEPALKIFCPDLAALRDTFRSIITVRLIYSVTTTSKPTKADKKGSQTFKPPAEKRVTLATIKCHLQRPDWTQPFQYFHWDDSLGTTDAMHWGDGDLSVLQYTQAPMKPAAKGKSEAATPTSKQILPENLTCHFGFGIHTLRP